MAWAEQAVNSASDLAMAKRPFKQDAREHFEAQTLSPSRLERLQNLARDRDPASRDESQRGQRLGAPARQRNRLKMSIAAVVLLGLLAAIGAQLWLNYTLADRIAVEVARNHLKLKPADIESTSLREIGDFLSHLDFSLVQSSQLDTSVWQLQGARYCEILGTTAAQLRMLRECR